MKRLHIIVEGDTEVEFIKNILKPFLIKNGIKNISVSKIKHSKGGLNKYTHLKTDILNCIYQSDIIVSTMIDYYGLPSDFPEYEQIVSTNDTADAKVDKLEEAIKNEINLDKNMDFNNFIPYIQLHEFEALIFSNIEVIKKLYSEREFNYSLLDEVIRKFPNPEEINDSIDTAPSKRLLSLYKGYNKIIDGNNILSGIGIETIMQKCGRFSGWIGQLIAKFENS